MTPDVLCSESWQWERVGGRSEARPTTLERLSVGTRPPSETAEGASRAFNQTLQLLAMDASARTTMKGAAKCDKHCELQNSVNQQNPERILCFRDIPESMSASESPLYPAALALSLAASLRVRARPCLLFEGWWPL